MSTPNQRYIVSDNASVYNLKTNFNQYLSDLQYFGTKNILKNANFSTSINGNYPPWTITGSPIITYNGTSTTFSFTSNGTISQTLNNLKIQMAYTLNLSYTSNNQITVAVNSTQNQLLNLSSTTLTTNVSGTVNSSTTSISNYQLQFSTPVNGNIPLNSVTFQMSIPAGTILTIYDLSISGGLLQIGEAYSDDNINVSSQYNSVWTITQDGVNYNPVYTISHPVSGASVSSMTLTPTSAVNFYTILMTSNITSFNIATLTFPYRISVFFIQPSTGTAYTSVTCGSSIFGSPTLTLNSTLGSSTGFDFIFNPSLNQWMVK